MSEHPHLERIRETEHAIDDVDEHLTRVLDEVARARAAAAAAHDTTAGWTPAEGDRP